MKDVVCNYAIARFRPYRETGEFVNVGVVLLCPQLGYFGYLFERRKQKRITDFFPELEEEVFKAGLQGLLVELARLSSVGGNSQYVLSGEPEARIPAVKELVRPRETLFHLSEAETVLAQDPHEK